MGSSRLRSQELLAQKRPINVINLTAIIIISGSPCFINSRKPASPERVQTPFLPPNQENPESLPRTAVSLRCLQDHSAGPHEGRNTASLFSPREATQRDTATKRKDVCESWGRSAHLGGVGRPRCPASPPLPGAAPGLQAPR